MQVAPGATINLQGEIDWTIAQTPGSAFLRTDRLRDTDVVMLRYGDRATCWLAADDGRLVRFENDSAARTRPVVFDVIEFGPHPIGGPEVASVVDVAEICDQYEAVSAP